MNDRNKEALDRFHKRMRLVKPKLISTISQSASASGASPVFGKAYAQLSGCRFRLASFDPVQKPPEEVTLGSLMGK